MNKILSKAAVIQEELRALKGVSEDDKIIFECQTQKEVTDIIIESELRFEKVEIHISHKGDYKFLFGTSYDFLLASCVYGLRDFAGKDMSLRALDGSFFQMLSKSKFKVVILKPSKIKPPKVRIKVF